MKARVLVADGTTEFASTFASARESARETFATTVSPPHNTTTQASIIILSYNSRAWLETLLPSLAQTRGSYEVIVADNNSNDGSVEFVAARHPEVRLIRNDGNLGYAAGNNRAAGHARADQLVFLNPDTRVEPDWLIELLKPFEDPTVGLTTSKLTLMSNPQELNTCGNDVHLSGITLCRGVGQPRDNFPDLEEVQAISGAAFAIRRKVFEAIGGFNESFFMYLEETALSLEARLRGWRCIYAPRSVVQHDYELRFGAHKVLYLERNRYMMLLQIYKWPTLFLLLPTLLLAEVLSWGFVLTRDRKNWANKLKAYLGLLRNWSWVMAKRQNNQTHRVVRDRELLARTAWALDFGQVSKGVAAKIAALVFNPLFWLARQLTLGLVRW